jgi:uncharacterized surface protein with fasciclin (FAS1) repeats
MTAMIRLLALSTVALAGLALTTVASEKSAASKDIVDTAVGAGNFKTLAKLLTDAGLVEVLKGEGPFTVFAPTDDAFKKVPAEVLEALAKDKDKLKKVLTYHVIKGKVMAADAVKLDGKEAETVAKVKLPIKVKGGDVMVGKAKVTKTDIACKNGVIHVIDTVLIPE